jgi:UDP-glucose 4-epimerase
MVIPRFVERALANSPIEIHGDGHQTRCFCHVHDTVRALIALMAEPSTSGQIYNVGSEERIRILDLADRVITAAGSTSELEFVEYDRVYGQGIEDMLHRIPSIRKVGDTVGWAPQYTLDEILADVIEHVRTASALAEV